MSRLPAMYGGTAPKPASDKSLAFMHALIRDRVLTDSIQSMINEACEYDQHPSQRACSAIIDALKQQPYKPRASTQGLDVSAIPDGRYAVPKQDDPDDFVFLQIRSADNGRRYVDMLTGAPGGFDKTPAGFCPDGTHYVKGNAPIDFNKALRKITLHPYGAAVAFGRAVGVCAVCGSPLTKKESREAGIGPVCAARF